MNVFWPDVDDSKNAHKACRSAAGMAFFVAIVTGTVTYLQTTGKINILPGLGPIAYVDVSLFVLIGIGLIFNSRFAAIAGLLLYIAERVFMIMSSGFRPSQSVAMIIFGLAFVSGVRGAFAWHAHKKLARGEAPAVISEEAAAEKPKKSFPGKAILLFVLILAVVAAAYFFLISKNSFPGIETLKQKIQIFTKSAKRKKEKPLVAPEGPAIKLKLKSGRLFEGILVKKNGEGYWIFIDGMGEVFFSTAEVTEVS